MNTNWIDCNLAAKTNELPQIPCLCAQNYAYLFDKSSSETLPHPYKCNWYVHERSGRRRRNWGRRKRIEGWPRIR